METETGKESRWKQNATVNLLISVRHIRWVRLCCIWSVHRMLVSNMFNLILEDTNDFISVAGFHQGSCDPLKSGNRYSSQVLYKLNWSVAVDSSTSEILAALQGLNYLTFDYSFVSYCYLFPFFKIWLKAVDSFSVPRGCHHIQSHKHAWKVFSLTIHVHKIKSHCQSIIGCK